MSLFLSLLFSSSVSVREKSAQLQGDACLFERRTRERYFLRLHLVFNLWDIKIQADN